MYNRFFQHKHLILSLPLFLTASLFLPSYVLLFAHAQNTGLVCITDSISATSCPPSAPTLGPFTVGQMFSVGVFIQNSDPMGGFDIYVAANNAYMTPVSAALGNLIVTPILTSICLNGAASTGDCTVNTANGPGVVEVATIDSSGGNECSSLAPCSGMAFTITYMVVGATPTTFLSYPTAPGCSASSVSSPANVCVEIADAFGINLIENIQGATVSIQHANPLPLSVTVSCPPTSTVGITVSCSATGSGGTPPFMFGWTATGGSPPFGSGPGFSTTYSTTGTYTIRVTLTDRAFQTATASATFTINPLAFAVTINCPATATVGTPVSCSATGSGGTLPPTFAWTATGGSQSSGTGSSFLTIYATVGTYAISVTGTDSSSPPNSQTRSATVRISAQTLAVAATTNQKTIFQFPSERAMFYAQGRTWIFFTNNLMGTVIPVYATSVDGQTWAQYSVTSIAGVSSNSSTPISAITNGTHVFLAWYQGSYGVMSKPLFVGIGRLISDGTIAWNSAITAVPATIGQRWYDPNLSLNADGTLFLSYRNATSTGGGGFAFATTAVAPYTSWASSFTLKASADTWRTSWINLNNGQEYVIYSPAGGCLRGRLYNGGFGGEETICNPASTRYVAFGFDNGTNTPTVIYQESNTERLLITYRVGGIWQIPRVIGYAETNSLPQWTVTFIPSVAKYYLIYYNYTTGTIWDYNGNGNNWSARTVLVNSVRGNSTTSIISYPIADSVGFAWTSSDASTFRLVDINFEATTVDTGPATSGSIAQLSIQSSEGCCQPFPYLPWMLIGIVATTTLITVLVNKRR